MAIILMKNSMAFFSLSLSLSHSLPSTPFLAYRRCFGLCVCVFCVWFESFTLGASIRWAKRQSGNDMRKLPFSIQYCELSKSARNVMKRILKKRYGIAENPARGQKIDLFQFLCRLWPDNDLPKRAEVRFATWKELFHKFNAREIYALVSQLRLSPSSSFAIHICRIHSFRSVRFNSFVCLLIIES